VTRSRLVLHCLPGFLGQPQDLEFLRELLPVRRGIPIDWRPAVADPRPGEGWPEWTARWLEDHPSPRADSDDQATEILLGYSLGGRAAAHLALSAPERFCGLIAISANPGLPSLEDRAARIQADEAWAQRFETEDWNSVLASWNAQAVFGGAAFPERLGARRIQDSPELRARCARQLRQFSLGRQEDLAPQLLNSKIRRVWITGERDSKFTEIARRLAESPASHCMIVPHAGHRWPWELSEAEAAAVIGNAIDFLLEQDSP
jgi:2-succinyl-6-hydroxy-2,4-cyclohexadiene-1-carboxylate synthase